MAIDSSPSKSFKWREPRLMRLRLHRDLGTRLFLCCGGTLGAASIFFLAGHFERQGNPLWASILGGTLIGFVISLGVVFRPEPLLGGSIQIKEGKIYRTLTTFDFGNGVQVKEQWPCRDLSCAIVPSEAIGRSFSVLVLPKSRNKHVFVGIPRYVIVEQLVDRLHQEQAIVTIAPELADNVIESGPYGKFVVVFSTIVAIAMWIAAAVIVVMNV